MDMKMCAASDVAKEWDKIDWNKANAYVKKLQMRIVKAYQEGKHGRVKSLQWLLTHSFYARALAVKRVTENRGKRTAGVDGICTNLVRMLAFVTCPFFVFQQKNPQNTQERHPQKEG